MSEQKKETIRNKLARTRQVVLDTVAGWSAPEWNTTVYGEGEDWTATDVLGHLMFAEKDMMRLMARIQQGEEGVPTDFDLDRWNAGRVRRARERSPADLLADMAANREALLAYLDGLGAEDWAKAGRHGSMQMMSIEDIFHRLAEHEMYHAWHLRRVGRTRI